MSAPRSIAVSSSSSLSLDRGACHARRTCGWGTRRAHYLASRRTDRGDNWLSALEACSNGRNRRGLPANARKSSVSYGTSAHPRRHSAALGPRAATVQASCRRRRESGLEHRGGLYLTGDEQLAQSERHARKRRSAVCGPSDRRGRDEEYGARRSLSE